jgi:hypothetical protein
LRFSLSSGEAEHRKRVVATLMVALGMNTHPYQPPFELKAILQFPVP